MTVRTFQHTIYWKQWCWYRLKKHFATNFVHIRKYLINSHNTNHRYRKMSRNWSALGKIISIQKWISQFDLYSLKFGFPNPPGFGAGALWKWSLLGRVRLNCLDLWPISYNCWKLFGGLSLDLWPNDMHINESFIKPRKYLNILVTLYLVHSTLCNNGEL